MTTRRRRSLLTILIVLLGCSGLAQQPPAQADTQPAAQPPAQNAVPANNLSSDDVIQLLTQSINWYRQNAVEQQIAKETSDLTFLADNQRIAAEVVQLAFDFAREAEPTAPRPSKPSSSNKKMPANSPPPNSAALAQYQSLVQASQKADQQFQQAQADVQALTKDLEGATGKKRTALDAQIAEAQSELALRQVRRDTLHNIIDFVSASAMGGSGFSGLHTQIDSLARSVPANLSAPSGSQAQSSTPGTPTNPIPVAVNPSSSEPTGLWELATELIHFSRKQRTLNEQIAATNDLLQTINQTRAPLIANLKILIQRGDTLSDAPPGTDPAALALQKQQIDALTAQFKTQTAVMLPLSKQTILLNIYKKSLNSWKDSVSAESREDRRNLLLRLTILLLIIGLVIAASRLTRRAITRYVHDGRRRYQFLLMERIFLWFALGLVLLFAFATQLGSVATFAGLITAGVALALQNVIVSIVGYFFLIGKFGIRVGDRVQISDVTGEVVDIGLVRLHLMELGGSGTDSQPTGRVVAFSNSIVFQPTSGIFKQIPGTSFAWHEITLTFTPDSYYQIIEKSMQQAVDKAFATYRDSMERQRQMMETSLNSISTSEIHPKVRLHFTPAGTEVTVRFPVIFQKASEIDDRVMGALLSAVEHQPGLNLLGSEMPTVKSDPAPETPPKTK